MKGHSLNGTHCLQACRWTSDKPVFHSSKRSHFFHSAIAEFTANDAAMPDKEMMMEAEDRSSDGNVRTKRNRLSGGGNNFAALQAGATVQLPRGCKFKAKSKARHKKARDDCRVDDDETLSKKLDATSFTKKLSRQKRASFLQNLFFGGGGGDKKAETKKRPLKPSRPPKRPPRPPYAPSPLVRLPRMPPKMAKSGPTGLALEMQLLSQSGSLDQGLNSI